MFLCRFFADVCLFFSGGGGVCCDARALEHRFKRGGRGPHKEEKGSSVPAKMFDKISKSAGRKLKASSTVVRSSSPVVIQQQEMFQMVNPATLAPTEPSSAAMTFTPTSQPLYHQLTPLQSTQTPINFAWTSSQPPYQHLTTEHVPAGSIVSTPQTYSETAMNFSEAEYFNNGGTHEMETSVDSSSVANGDNQLVDANSSYLITANAFPDRFAERMVSMEKKLELILEKFKLIEERQTATDLLHTNLTVELKGVKDVLVPLNAKLDSIGIRDAQLAVGPKKPPPFKPATTEAELLDLNEKAQDAKFISETIEAFATVCGHNTMSNQGWDVGLKIIDLFATRELFHSSSYTGGSSDPQKEAKICLGKYKHFLNLIVSVILYSDPQWDETKNKNFIVRAILNNSTQRLNRDKQLKTPKSRFKQSIVQTEGETSNETEDNDDDNDEDQN